SAAEQMAARAGTCVNAARKLLETSQRVADLPKTEAAVRSGALSTQQGAAGSAAAVIAPGEEDEVLEIAARRPLGELQKGSVRAKASVGVDETHERITRERSLREYTDEEGAWVLHARGPLEAGQAFRAAITPIIDRYFKVRREPEQREPREAYAFDALIELA